MGLFNKKYLRQIAQLQERLSSLENQLSDERSKNEKYGIYKYEDSVEKIDKLNGDALKKLNSLAAKVKADEQHLENLSSQIQDKSQVLDELTQNAEKKEKQLDTQTRKVKRAKELCKAMLNAYDYDDKYIASQLSEAELLAPSVTAELKRSLG